MMRISALLVISLTIACTPTFAINQTGNKAELKSLFDTAITAIYFDNDYSRGVELLEKYIASEPNADGKAFNELANAYRHLNKPREAAAAYIKAAQKLDMTAPDSFYKAIESLEKAGLTQEAENVYETAFDWHRNYGHWVDRMRTIYVRRHDLLITARRFAEALALEREQVSLMDKYEVPGRAQTRIRVMSEIAQLCEETGDASAILEYGPVLAGIVNEIPYNDRHTSMESIPLLNPVARYYALTGDYARADSAWTTLTRVETAPDSHAANLTGYATFLSQYGRAHDAIKLYDQAIDTYLGIGNKGAAALAALSKATTAKNIKEWDTMKDACSQVAGLVSQFGTDANVSKAMKADVLFDLAGIYSEAQLTAQAIEIYERILPFYRSEGQSRLQSLTQANLGSAYAKEGRHSDALRCYAGATEWKDISLYPNLYRSVQNNKASSLYKTGHTKEAIEIYRRLLDDLRDTMQHVFVYMTDRERHEFWRQQYYIFDNIHAMQLPPDIIGALRYDAALANKGILLDTSIRLRNIISRSSDTVLQADFNRLRSLLARPRHAETNAAIAATERDIQQRVARLADYTRGSRITLADICRQLGEHDHAVEIVRHNGPDGRYAYEALITDANGIVAIEPLPAEAFIESLGQNAIYTDPALLADAFWTPILRHVGTDGRLYISPDGIYHRIAFEHLPYRGKAVSRTMDVRRVSSTRNIVTSPIQMQGEFAVWGGLDYNSESEEDSGTDITTEAGNIMRLGSGTSLWTYLPGTRREMQAIAGILGQTRCTTVTKTADEGSESAFKALSGHSPAALHIATHGFYLPGEKADNTSSLLRSGLVLSGANNSWGEGRILREGANDGILTASEISNIDLSNSRLIVLSACQSGLGDIESEGVFGLPRAFKQSGAGSIVMSLWAIDDEITQRIMVSLYRGLAAGQPLREALAEACATCGDDNPASWAAFVVID